MSTDARPPKTLRIGTWFSCIDIAVVEVPSQAEFDFILVDGEQGHAPVHLIHTFAGAVRSGGRKLVYRVAANRVEPIKSALDQGADAVMVPMVNTGEEARAAVRAAKYAPVGERGIGPLRASGYYRNFGAYMQMANAATELIVQIESRTGVENCLAIARLEGGDQLFVGPADLAASLGLPLGTLNNEMLDVFVRVAQATTKNGKVAGIDCAAPSLIPRFREMGFSFFSIGSDLQYLAEGANAMVQACKAL
ncbi:MAG: hypothetical protein LBE86_05145 [Gemmobacter sp.]|nr:hypothetical protein [Gemmobacter sp.]